MANAKCPRPVLSQDPVWDVHRRKFRRETGSDEIAAELTQELQCRLLAWQAKNGGPPRHLPGFIAVISARISADWIRAEQRRRALAPSDLERDGEPHDPEPQPDALAHREVWRGAVVEALASVPLTERQRAILNHWHDEIDAVARLLGTSDAAVRTERSKLRKRLSRNPRLRELFEVAPGC